jgi:hypothetical protein
MSTAKKKKLRKDLKKRKVTTVIVTQHLIDAKDTLFPEKVAKANEMLKNIKIDEIDWSRKP